MGSPQRANFYKPYHLCRIMGIRNSGFMTQIHMPVMDGFREKSKPPVSMTEENALKLYSERLVRKLAQKMAQAEQEIQARKKLKQIC